MRTLIVASPKRRGQLVKDAQYTLAGHNVFKQNFQPGEVDGVFGESSGRACKRAKYWLGYPESRMRGDYGSLLNNFLSGKRKLPPSYAKRRKTRLAAKPKVPLREKALQRARTQIGVTESPRGSNNTSYGRWYGANGNPWCAMFVTWCYVHEGSKRFRRGVRYSYVPWIVADARRGINGLSVTRHPQPGDLVCFDWEGDGVADHVGLFEKWLANGMFQTIEGNTAVGNDSNGGEVMRRERNGHQVKAFVHAAL